VDRRQVAQLVLLLANGVQQLRLHNSININEEDDSTQTGKTARDAKLNGTVTQHEEIGLQHAMQSHPNYAKPATAKQMSIAAAPISPAPH
jgi:hypothetical protein